MKVIESMAALAVGVLLPVLAACLILSQLAGCFSGGEFYFGARRIDEFQETKKLINQPWHEWKCLFLDCNEGEEWKKQKP